ncbi:MAG: SDR family oxidoreductase [Chloroflexi bacterium]|nr:SDR family oxidoreductase [Chloroflexota bacterium]
MCKSQSGRDWVLWWMSRPCGNGRWCSGGWQVLTPIVGTAKVERKMGRLEGKVALISGAARGIGAAIATRFAGEGASLVLVDVLVEELQRLAEGLVTVGGVVEVVGGDVADEETWRQAVNRAEERFRRLDILVNNAGAAEHRSVTDLSVALWRRTLDVCLTSAFLGAKYAIPVMQRQQGGAIINISSVNSLVATPGMPAYTAAKGGMTALTRQLAVEYGPDGIRTNEIRPGLIATPETVETVLADSAEERAALESCPLRRVGQPEDIAATALFLASEDAAYINGVALTVDGGTTAQWPPILVRPALRRKARLPVE